MWSVSGRNRLVKLIKKGGFAPMHFRLSHAEFTCCKRAEVDRLIVVVYSEFKRDASRFSVRRARAQTPTPVI
jgi:hypothetical protein